MARNGCTTSSGRISTNGGSAKTWNSWTSSTVNPFGSTVANPSVTYCFMRSSTGWTGNPAAATLSRRSSSVAWSSALKPRASTRMASSDAFSRSSTQWCSTSARRVASPGSSSTTVRPTWYS